MYPPTEAIPVIICTAAVMVMREQGDILQQKGILLLAGLCANRQRKALQLQQLLEGSSS
jgi:hypothetical protein